MDNKIIISACLYGKKVNYKGEDNLDIELVEKYGKDNVILVCPEVLGGLRIPRIKSEIIEGTKKVINEEGEDVTTSFEIGAEKVLKIAKENNVKLAILKSKSPSCGVNLIYNGRFEKKLVKGNGICADLLIKNGIEVINEKTK